MDRGAVRIVGDKAKSPWYAGITARDCMKTEWGAAANPLETAVAQAQVRAAEMREAVRLYEAQRYRPGGVKLDPVLRHHLGL